MTSFVRCLIAGKFGVFPQARCRREALIRGRELLLQVQRLFTEAFQGIKPSVGRLRGECESGGKRLAIWASWLRQEQLESLAAVPFAPLPETTQRAPVMQALEALLKVGHKELLVCVVAKYAVLFL